ncbi:arf-GAP with dual PH domain-containing protein 1-like isoform X2 [Erythrolamprus reginae]|uniref:arf-GAP with dual PH domain-containing protein 1-like isoform X2 n=1 Tax=Erythrolamprus reginae TaxID=121349 RepID=UPI00396C7AFD
MAAEDEKNTNLLQEVWKIKENTMCADCGQPDPCWVSCTLGTFICHGCSEIHYKIPHISEVKSIIKQNCWEESQIQFLAQHGNALAKATYEAHVPAYYYRPFYSDSQVLREQWIRAKYERKEFLEPKKEVLYSNGLKEGILWKRSQDNQLYRPRRFLLSEKERCLKYFVKPDAKEPKIEVKIDTVNAMFQTEKMRHPNGLQITYLKHNKTCNIFVYHEHGKEIVDWFNAIRAVKFHHLKVAFPGASDEELKTRLTRNFLKEGYMEKTGPKDAFAKGEIFLGNGEQGYNVIKGLPYAMKGSFTWKHGIVIVTPDRKYIFTCETEKEQEEWRAIFSYVIEQPMTPQEYAIEANFRIKH